MATKKKPIQRSHNWKKPALIVPGDAAFVRHVAELMCLHAGDSWVSDDGAQDCWSDTATNAIWIINSALAYRAKRETVARGH